MDICHLTSVLYHVSRALIGDLFVLSQNNPSSVNYAGGMADLAVLDQDEQFQPERDEATKSIVFSQWTSLLDRSVVLREGVCPARASKVWN